MAAVRRPGTDVSLIAYSRMVQVCLEAAEQLAGAGIHAEVIDLRSLRPLDLEALDRSISKTRHAVLVEETAKGTSIGGDIIGLLQEQVFSRLDAPIRWLAGVAAPMPYNRALERASIPSAEVVVQETVTLLGGAQRRAA